MAGAFARLEVLAREQNQVADSQGKVADDIYQGRRNSVLTEIMKSSVVKVERIHEQTLPPGTYFGKWSAYQVTIQANNGSWRLRTVEGVRGISDCTVSVATDGQIEVNAK